MAEKQVASFSIYRQIRARKNAPAAFYKKIEE